MRSGDILGVSKLRLLGSANRGTGDLDLGCGAPPRKVFHGIPVPVAAREIHRAVDPGGVLSQCHLDRTDGFEEAAPVKCVDEPNAGDRVGDRDLQRRLPVVLVGAQRLQGLGCRRDPLLELLAHRRRHRLLCGQPLMRAEQEESVMLPVA